MKPPPLKAKGRALSAARIGLRNAERRFREIGDKEGAEECRAALGRMERMERSA